MITTIFLFFNSNLSIIDHSEQKLEIPISSTFWATRQSTTQTARVQSSDNSGTFLTGINNEFEQQEDEETKPQSKPNTSPILHGNDENSLDLSIDLDVLNKEEEKKKISLHKSNSVSTNIQHHPLLPLINSVSTLDLLKIRQNYSKIYTSRYK